ncbi:MAG: hypothetical protein ACM33U_09080 [Solirubrobacterales bacterium]|nr:hypothetical protein [Solirubrobacterales bacterium]
MSTIGSLLIKLGIDNSGVDSGIAQTTSKLGGIKTAAQRAVAPAVVTLGALTLGAKKTVDAASAMNETVSKTGVVFGPAAKSIEAFGTGAAKDLGISKQAALDATAMYGTFGKAAGLTGKALKDFSIPLTQAAADLASFHNVPVDQALEDIRSGLAGETEPLRKYGILLNDAALREQALRMGLTKSTKDTLPANVKMLAAQKLILDKLGPAQGDFARTSSSAANQARIQAAESANLQAKLGSGLLPAYQMLQGILLRVTGFMSQHTGAMKIAVGIVAALAGGVLAVNGALKVYEAATKIAAAAQWLFNAAVNANPITLIIGALVALGVALVVAYKKSETFRNIVNGAFDMVKSAAGFMKDVVSTALDGIRTALSTVEKVALKVKDAFVTAKNWVVSNWPIIATIISGPFAPLVALATNAFGVRSALVGAFTAVKTFVGGVVGDIVGFFRELPGKLLGFATSAGSAIVSGFKSGLSAFGSAVASLIKAPLNALIGAWNRLGIPGFGVHINLPGPVPDINFSWGGISLPDIPTLDRGGLVTRTGMAEVHRGEVFSGVPVPQGGGNTYNFNFPNYIGSKRELEDAVVEALASYGRRNGVAIAQALGAS